MFGLFPCHLPDATLTRYGYDRALGLQPIYRPFAPLGILAERRFTGQHFADVGRRLIVGIQRR